MSFLLYQRADPRHEDWLPLKSQQIRLRNLVQIIGVNLIANENSELYFTLHVTPLSAPFFTSERVPKKAGQRVQQWKEIEPEHAYYSGIKFSAKGCTIRIWSRSSDGNCHAVLTWGIYFEGLHRLGSQNDWSSDMFVDSVILFRTPFGVYTDESCIKPRPTSLTRYLVISKPQYECRPSYKCKLLASLHRKQRAIIEEVELAIVLKSECEILAFPETRNVPVTEQRIILSSRGRKIRPGSKTAQLALKKEIDEVRFKVLSLAEEKSRAEGRLQRMKKERLGLDEMNKELVNRLENLNNERLRLQQFKIALIDKRQKLTQLRSEVFVRKKQLISELSVIYPLTLIDSVKRYSINGVQLPESDLQGYEGGGQASVALGYTAHLVSMLCFFLGIPLRYPIRHFGSRSRILDHITANIPEREREFPLYFKGKPDIFSIYGAYLLNKNVAQIRWYCGLVTQDLRATLPNLASLIHNRLAIKGWDQSYDDDSLEMAQELTEETDKILFRSENSVSLDKGLDQIDLRVSTDKNQGNLSSSVANIDYAANNSAALGDIYRGRAQEKFLSGWRKGGITQPEEIDPAWAVSSMDADSDCGRRISTCVGRSFTPDFDSSLVSNSSGQSKIRRRRIGQVSLPEQVPDDRHVYNVPMPSRSIQPIPDDSVQAKQLRLLDRKISMYFGDRSNSSRGPAVRKARSFDKTCDNNEFEVSSMLNSTQSFEIQGETGVGSQPSATNMIVNIGEPYFSCNVNSEVSDLETDNCDYHVNPPVEVIAKNEPDLATFSSEHTKTPESSISVTDLHPNLQQTSNLELQSKQTLATLVHDFNDNTGLVDEVPCGGEDSSIQNVSTESLAKLLEGVDPNDTDKGLDDESLWNRTEALMSSYQSFNLIRKSTIEPK